MDGRGESDDYFGGVGVGGGKIDGAKRQVAGAEIALDSAAPGAHEGEVEDAADYGAGQRDEAADPFFGGFFAEFYGQTLGDARGESFDHLFFGEVLAEIDAGGGGGGEPEFAALIGAGGIKSIEKSKTLDQAQGDDGEESRVGNQRDQAAEAKARAFSERDALGVANHHGGDVVETFDGDAVHVAEVGDVQAMLLGEVAAKIFGIDFDGAESAEEAKTQEALERRGVFRVL